MFNGSSHATKYDRLQFPVWSGRSFYLNFSFLSIVCVYFMSFFISLGIWLFCSFTIQNCSNSSLILKQSFLIYSALFLSAWKFSLHSQFVQCILYFATDCIFLFAFNFCQLRFAFFFSRWQLVLQHLIFNGFFFEKKTTTTQRQLYPLPRSMCSFARLYKHYNIFIFKKVRKLIHQFIWLHC